ncbi:hypothetical protein M8J77_017338 [Diaphorina citri]|nr:hypothetical protein M8J77_017338 [Diaphorina citri]
MSEFCSRCEEPLPTEGDLDYATCSICCNGYHFMCTTVGESSWRTMGETRRGAWKCPTCRSLPNVESRGGTGTPQSKDGKERACKQKETTKQKEPTSELSNLETDSASIKQLLDKIGALEKSITEKINAGFTSSRKDMKDVKEKIAEFETSLNFYGDQVDKAVCAVKVVEQNMILMENRLKKSESENKEMKARLRSMEIQVNGLNQKEFNNKIEIAGIKNNNVEKDEVTRKILDKIENRAGEIQFKTEKLTREGENGKTTIVVEFKTQEVRNLVLTKIKEKRLYSQLDDVFPNNGSNVYINEALCPYYKKLFYQANKIKKDKKYAYLWVKDGRILLKKADNGKTMRLECLDDLGKI